MWGTGLLSGSGHCPTQLRPQTVARLLEGEGGTGVPEVENDSLKLMLGNWFGHCGLPLPRVEQWG